MATIVRIYDSRIQSMFMPGGDVWDFTRDISRDAVRASRIYAPWRTGTLAKSMEFSVTPAPGKHCIGTLRATARHGLWVVEGTKRIYPRPGNARGLRVPIRPGTTQPRKWRPSVRGQRPNNFMMTAVESALRAKGVI